MNFIFNLIGLLNSDIFVKTEHKRKKTNYFKWIIFLFLRISSENSIFAAI